jgi:DNA-binding transcriptional ArsR family regulator
MQVVHLVPAERRTRRILEEDRVCTAIDAIGEPANLTAWAARFGLLGDPNRLALLLSIAQAGPISVTDLAVAADMNDTTVSQALRLLRASGTVVARRDGRIIRYELADDEIGQLLKQVSGLPSSPPHYGPKSDNVGLTAQHPSIRVERSAEASRP